MKFWMKLLIHYRIWKTPPLKFGNFTPHFIMDVINFPCPMLQCVISCGSPTQHDLTIFCRTTGLFYHDYAISYLPGSFVTKIFSSQFKIKFQFAVTQIQMNRSLWIFAHGTTAVLSWHERQFIAMSFPGIKLWWNEVSIEFDLCWKRR